MTSQPISDTTAYNPGVGVYNAYDNYGMFNPAFTANGNAFNNSIFGAGTSSYTGDYMMSGIDFNKLAADYLAGKASVAPQTPKAQSFTSAHKTDVPEEDVPKQKIAQPEETNIGKITGGVLGFSAPLAVGAYDMFRDASFKNAFKFKQLIKSCPILAAVGVGVGMLIDGFLNKKKASAA